MPPALGLARQNVSCAGSLPDPDELSGAHHGVEQRYCLVVPDA